MRDTVFGNSKNRFLVLLSILCLVGSYAYFSRELAAYVPLAISTPNELHDFPRIIAHKALGTEAPGNTLEAVQRLMSSEIDGIELDIQLSADGVPFVFHESHLDGHTTGSGLASAKTWAELRDLEVMIDGKRSGYRIPALQQVFQTVGRSKYLFLDAKDFGARDTGMARALADLIRSNDVYSTVVVESFNPVFLMRLRREDPQVRRMLDFADDVTPTAEETPAQLAQIPWLLKQGWFRRRVIDWVRPDILGPRFSVSPESLGLIARKGYPLIAWTVDDPGLALSLFQKGVRGVETNTPFELNNRFHDHLSQSVDDASGLNPTRIAQVIRVQTEDDVRRALSLACSSGKKVSIAGRRHSMGGQALGTDHILLDMSGLNRLSYDRSNDLLTVGSGATWAQVQRFLDPIGRSVRVMQSDNIFTVGGSLSVNAHGWEPCSGPIASTVERIRLMVASGEVKTCSRRENPELFRAALGGYGLLGVILDAEIHTVSNRVYRKTSRFFPVSHYAASFEKHVANNPNRGLAYGRLSVDDRNFLSEAGLHVFEVTSPQPEVMPPMTDESLVQLKREIFRASERSDLGKLRRWILEKNVGPWLDSGGVTRNTVMNPDIHFLWPKSPGKRDVLHEYFVPCDHLSSFVDAMRTIIRRHNTNLLNVTIRDVRRDEDSLLPYAKRDVFGLVLLFSQDNTAQGEDSMRRLTQDLVEIALDHGGSFYLPYRLHYTKEQFRRAYPAFDLFLAIKRKYDPATIFSSKFYHHITGDLRDPAQTSRLIRGCGTVRRKTILCNLSS